MELTIESYLILFPLVFLAAVVDSIGGGGGLISLPAYSLIGLPYGLASGCNKFSASFGAVAATIRFIKSKKILWLPAAVSIVGALPCSWLGTYISNQLGNEFMHKFMICAIPVVAVVMLLKKNEVKESKPVTRGMLGMCLLTGIVTGFYDGFFGPGTGTFIIFMFTALAGMDMVTASATAKPVNLVSNVTSLVARIAAGQIIYALVIPAVCFSMTGAWIGSKLVLTRGAKVIRFVMLGVMALLVVTLAAEMM